MEREQFTFYRSFWEALKALPQKDQLPFVLAVCSHAFGEESKPLKGAALASFLLVKPILDKASKKAASGKKGGSKREANGKQTGSKTEANQNQNGSEIEGEKEEEVEEEVEVEVEDECPPPTPSSAVAYYLDRANPMASQTSLEELANFERVMGFGVCQRAIDIARDEKKVTWSYIRAILRDKQERGVKCLADWEALEKSREQAGAAQKTGRKSWAALAAEMDAEEGME